MSLLTIVKYPHPTLARTAAPITSFDEALGRLIDDMAETMYAAQGVGLAANQVNVLHRVTVLDCAAEGAPPQLLEVVNPQIVAREGHVTWEEGCLSLPDVYEKVKRAARVRVAYQTRSGAPAEIAAEGLLAVALQHEIDHLDGVMFIDRIGPLTRRRALERYGRVMTQRRVDGVVDVTAE